MSSTTIYLKRPQVKEVYAPEVYLGMIADVHSSDRAAEAKAKAVKITSFSGQTYQVKDELKKRGYKFRNGSWVKE